MSWNKLSEHERTQLNNHLTNPHFSCYVLSLAGCSYKTISDMVGKSQRTVRTHIDRAKQIHTNIIEGD